MKLKEVLDRLFEGEFSLLEKASLSDLKKIEEALTLDKIARLVLSQDRYEAFIKDPSKIQDWRIEDELPSEVRTPEDLLVYMAKKSLLPPDLIEKLKTIRKNKGLQDTREIVAVLLKAKPNINTVLAKLIKGDTTTKDIDKAIARSGDKLGVTRKNLYDIASK
jgi:hypothetical protein